MAFFKFRQRGQSLPEPRGRAEDAAATPQETLDSLRRRARHRLIGAAVLVLVAVIGFPLLFDTQPRPVSVDAPIVIPDKDKVAPLRPPEEAPAAPPAAAPEPAPARPPEPARPADDAGARAPEPSAADEATQARREEAARQLKREEEAAEAARVKREQEARARREAEERARREEAARARALLEGRSVPAATAAAGAAAESGRFVVQVGAFADADKVRQVRQQIESAGLKTYTQTVNTREGPRTRVRVGPYASRAEAEKAAAALKKAGLAGSILAL